MGPLVRGVFVNKYSSCIFILQIFKYGEKFVFG